MSNKMAVKIKTSVVIDALEKALTLRKKKFADSDKADKEYEKAKEQYQAELVKLAKSPKAQVTEVNTYERWYNPKKDTARELTVTIRVPVSAMPKEPENKADYPQYRYASEVEEITNALRLLTMTDQEYVNASTMKSVSQYL
jgi:hypothetical protein